MTTDPQLITQVQAGNTTAFATLVHRHERGVRAVCLHILHDRQLAEDAAQESFLAAYRALPSLRDPNAFGGWLRSIAAREALRLSRSRSRPITTLTQDTEPSTTDTAQDDDEALLAAVMTLPDHERDVIIRKHFDNQSAEEIATALARPLGTITKQLSRAYNRLRQTLTNARQKETTP